MIFEWNTPGDRIIPKDGMSCLLLLYPEKPYNSGSIVSGIFRESIGGWVVDHIGYIYTYYSVDRWMPNPFIDDPVNNKTVDISLKIANFTGSIDTLLNEYVSHSLS